jgi:hypothetical protein
VRRQIDADTGIGQVQSALARDLLNRDSAASSDGVMLPE